MRKNRKIPYSNGLKSILPDRYQCPYYCGNTCDFNIIKFDSYYEIEPSGCTEMGCLDEELDTTNYDLCFENWILSKDIYYEEFPDFINNCINGYRNITYIKQQQALDKSFTAATAKTLEHTFVSLNNGIKLSFMLYELLKDRGKFDESELLSFSAYMRWRNVPYFSRVYTLSEKERKQVAAQKEIFDYISADTNTVKDIVPNEIIEFQKQYARYRKSLYKYGKEALEEKLDRLGY